MIESACAGACGRDGVLCGGAGAPSSSGNFSHLFCVGWEVCAAILALVQPQFWEPRKEAGGEGHALNLDASASAATMRSRESQAWNRNEREKQPVCPLLGEPHHSDSQSMARELVTDSLEAFGRASRYAHCRMSTMANMNSRTANSLTLSGLLSALRAARALWLGVRGLTCICRRSSRFRRFATHLRSGKEKCPGHFFLAASRV